MQAGAGGGLRRGGPRWGWEGSAGRWMVDGAGGLARDQTGGAPLFNRVAAQLTGRVAGDRDIQAGLMAGLT